MVKWLQEHMAAAYKVTCQGKTKALMNWMKGKALAGNRAQANVGDIINDVGAVCLATYFEELAREYPAFSVVITSANREQAVQDALRSIAGGARTKQAAAGL